MPVVRAVAPLILLATVTVAGCGGGTESGRRPPQVGAPSPTHASVPAEPMDRLENPVADQLRPRLAEEGLSLEYVDCPPWAGSVPHSVECRAFVDGLVAQVQVRLAEDDHGGVAFDAWLEDGLVATSRLVNRLEEEGWHTVDCGSAAAYPARPGLEIVCRVHRGGTADYVVATVVDRRGGVRIADY